MGSLNMRDRLLALAERRVSDVVIDGEVYRVREPMQADVNRFLASKDANADAAVAQLLVDCMVDEAGEPLLSLDDALRIAAVPRVATPLVDAVTASLGVQKKG